VLPLVFSIVTIPITIVAVKTDQLGIPGTFNVGADMAWQIAKRFAQKGVSDSDMNSAGQRFTSDVLGVLGPWLAMCKDKRVQLAAVPCGASSVILNLGGLLVGML